MRNLEFIVDIETQGLGLDADLVRRAVLATLRHQSADFDGEVSVSFVQDDEMTQYNRQYRGKDGTTDVLSFPQFTVEEIANHSDEFICLGDIIINVDAVHRQAEDYGHDIKREAAFLTVHSVLHLLGYTHDDEAQEARMFAVQEEILEEMGLGR